MGFYNPPRLFHRGVRAVHAVSTTPCAAPPHRRRPPPPPRARSSACCGASFGMFDTLPCDPRAELERKEGGKEKGRTTIAIANASEGGFGERKAHTHPSSRFAFSLRSSLRIVRHAHARGIGVWCGAFPMLCDRFPVYAGAAIINITQCELASAVFDFYNLVPSKFM